MSTKSLPRPNQNPPRDLRDLRAMLSPMRVFPAQKLRRPPRAFRVPTAIPLRDLRAMLSPLAWFPSRSQAVHQPHPRTVTSNQFQPAEKPTMYFIGVTTSKSSINQIFPLWAEYLQLGSCQLKGVDFELHDRPELYREAVEFIKGDPFSLGALVTTHKIDLCKACRDIFDVLDPLSDSMEEVSSIFKRGGALHGRAVDPTSSGLALEAFLHDRSLESDQC